MEWLVIWILCGIAAGAIAANKGRSGCGWLIIGFLLGPFGIAFALISKKDTAVLEQKALSEETMRKCPHCAELVRVEAKVCRFCQRDLPAEQGVEMGTCPNCKTSLPMNASRCACGIKFLGIDGGWAVQRAAPEKEDPAQPGS